MRVTKPRVEEKLEEMLRYPAGVLVGMWIANYLISLSLDIVFSH